MSSSPMSDSTGVEKAGGAHIPQTRLASQTNVLSRLHALFPGSGQTASRETVTSNSIAIETKLDLKTAENSSSRHLKMRIVTWNMHDSLPKGSLEDLLGVVPHYEPLHADKVDSLKIPKLDTVDCHPYHVVVVAGQECPTVSGIPMGLAAAFKHKEEKHKDEEKKQGKSQGKDTNDTEEPQNREPQAASSLSNDAASGSAAHAHASGWSWILEEWFCHGLGEASSSSGTKSAYELYKKQAINTASSDEVDAQQNDPVESHLEALENTQDQRKPKSKGQKEAGVNRIGPYELLAKERLMGIYIAVFIYRDLKPLVRNFSKSAVAAGLIGGRVGNKGGVGVSVNIAGKTLLFVNAHLAAHEDRVMSRVANMNKIKNELQVSDFLTQDDPRVMSEDLTDKFDYTFIFGDLNFRLNVTRLHADWLIGRKEYNQALAFDQLRKLIDDGEAFVGFKEGQINFPPTFKYDVTRGVKRDKSHLSREILKRRESRENKKRHSQLSYCNLSEVHEVDSEHADIKDEDAKSTAELLEPSRTASIDTDDNRSLVSTIITATSTQSRATLAEDEDYPSHASRTPDSDMKNTPHAAHKDILMKAVMKAKDKWLTIVKQREPRPQIRRDVSRKRRHDFSASNPHLSSASSKPIHTTKSSTELDRISKHDTGLSPPQAPRFLDDLRRISSKRSKVCTNSIHRDNSIAGTAGKASDSVETEGSCYDTSSKQRVPSWCDRILWKSTVHVESDSEEEEEGPLNVDQRSGLGPRMLQFLAQALKPLSTRTRALSLSSVDVSNPTESPPARHSKLPPRAITIAPSNYPLTGVTMRSEDNTVSSRLRSLPSLANIRSKKTRPPKLGKSKSIEPTTTTPLLSPNFRERGRTQSVAVQISAPIIDSPLPEREHTDLEESEQAVAHHREEPRHNIASGKSWRFFPFLSREGEAPADADSSKVAIESPTKIAMPRPTARRPRKGEVVVLGYRSLDDQAMRRLEGKSDHRPVIGSYAIIL